MNRHVNGPRAALPAWWPLVLLALALGLGSCRYEKGLLDYCHDHPDECLCPNNVVEACCAVDFKPCRLNLPNGQSDCCAQSDCFFPPPPDYSGPPPEQGMGICHRRPGPDGGL